MYAAFEALPPAMRERLANLKCKHDATRNSTGQLRAGFAETYDPEDLPGAVRSEEHTSELQSLMRISYAVFCLKKKRKTKIEQNQTNESRLTSNHVKH